MAARGVVGWETRGGGGERHETIKIVKKSRGKNQIINDRTSNSWTASEQDNQYIYCAKIWLLK